MNTKLLREKAEVLDKLRFQRNKLIASRNAILAVKCGQETAALSIAGIRFSVTKLNNYYAPEAIKGMETIQAECAKILQYQIETIESQIIGAENALRRLVSHRQEAV